MADHYQARRERLLSQLSQAGLDGLLVSNPVNVTYLTGFSGDSSYLVLAPQQALLLSDGRFTEQIEEECPGLAAHIRPPSQTLQQAAGEVLKKLGLRSLGYDGAHLTVADFQTLRELAPTVDWKEERGRVEALRMCKDDWELEQIGQAIAIAEKAFAMFRVLLRGQDSEKELADSMEMYVRRAGGTCSSFPPIIAAGARAALPHAVPTARRLAADSLLLVDWGAAGRFYKSDLTRVLFRRTTSTLYAPRGTATEQTDWRPVYAVVLKAQTQALAALRPGARAGDVDAAARAVISEAGYGDYFLHSVGHGIGLQVHEGPGLRPGAETRLEPGMVVTIEPGIYLPGRGGIRIEDDAVITPDGCQVLTHVPRDWEAQLVEY